MQTKSNADQHRTVTAGSTLKAIATAALLAATLLGATAARAGLVVTSATRSLVADTSISDEISTKTFATDGVFNIGIQSTDGFNNSNARAFQESDIQSLTFVGRGSTRVNLFDGDFGSAESVYSLFFTLSGAFEFDGLVDLEASGNAFSHASFVLERLGAGGGIVESGLDTGLAFSGTLGAGDYSLVATASSSSIDPNEFGQAAFDLRLGFTDLSDPPAAVPEPQSLALALAGLLACGLVRRRGPAATAERLQADNCSPR